MKISGTEISDDSVRALQNTEFDAMELWLLDAIGGWGLSIKECERRHSLGDYALPNDATCYLRSEDFTGPELVVADCIGCDGMTYEQIAQEMHVSVYQVRKIAKSVAEKYRSSRPRGWPMGSYCKERRSGWVMWSATKSFNALCGASSLGLPNGGIREWLLILKEEDRAALWNMGDNWVARLADYRFTERGISEMRADSDEQVRRRENIIAQLRVTGLNPCGVDA